MYIYLTRLLYSMLFSFQSKLLKKTFIINSFQKKDKKNKKIQMKKSTKKLLINHKKKGMINSTFLWISQHFSSNTTTLLFEYSNISDRKNCNKYTCCTCSKQITWFQKKLRSLFSWLSAFDICKNDSNRAIFDVDYQVWNESFLKPFKSWDFDVLRQASASYFKKKTLRIHLLYSQRANHMISKKSCGFY
jgi:hypothetical protein